MTGGRDLRLRWRSAALDEESGLTLGERLTVCVLAEHVNGADGGCRLRLTTIGAELGGLRTRQTRRLVRGLEAKGWLEIDERAGHSSSYRPRLPETTRPRSPMTGANTHTPDMTPVTHDRQNQRTRRPSPHPLPSSSADRDRPVGDFNYVDLLRDMP